MDAAGVFCRFVAHPRQMRDWKGDPPNLYDISGSAHFINKCDNGVVVHRNNDPNKGPQSEVGLPYVSMLVKILLQEMCLASTVCCSLLRLTIRAVAASEEVQ